MTLRRLLSLALTVSALLVAAVPPLPAGALPRGSLTVQVRYDNDAQLRALAEVAGDVQNVNPAAGTCELATNEVGLERLAAQGYQYRLLNASEPDFPTCYRTVVSLTLLLQSWEAAYPSLVQVTDYGDSWDKTIAGGPEGFDLFVLRLTNENITGTKARIFMDGGLHARELVPPELMVSFAERLLGGYGVDPDLTALLDYSEIYLVLTSNPDGHLKNEQNFSLWRKNTDSDDGCGTTYGVDLNRNHWFKWACCGGSSGSPCNETYRGPSPNSEPEILSYEDFVRGIFPDQRGPGDNDPAPITTTGMLFNHHSYGGTVLHPWGWTTNPAPNSVDLIAIANKYATYNGYNVQSALYPVDGNTRDWAYGEFGIPGYVIEMGTTFWESCSNLPNVINENLPAVTYMSKLADMPYLRIRGPETNTPISVERSGNVVTVTATVNYAWTNNTYLQNVAAAELYVDTPPSRGGTPIAMQAVDGAFDEPTEQVRAVYDASSLPNGRHLLFVRGRGVNSYQGYLSWGPTSSAFLDIGVITPTPSATPTATGTPVAPTNTPTATAEPPTATPSATATPPSPAAQLYLPLVVWQAAQR
jgi:hypothetical protein